MAVCTQLKDVKLFCYDLPNIEFCEFNTGKEEIDRQIVNEKYGLFKFIK